MQLVCPKCESSYAVADTALGEHGRQVRCVRCKHVWFATPPVLAPAMAEAAVAADQPHDHDAVAESELDAQIGSAAPAHVDDAPSISPEAADAPDVEQQESTSSSDYFAVRRRKVAKREAIKQRGWGITPPRVAAALAGIIIALLLGRETVAKIFPQTVSLYSRLGLAINLRGLEFNDIKTSYETHDGARVMVVEGEIRNISSSEKSVPKLKFTLRNAAGVEIYGWTGTPDLSKLPPGEVQKFRSRLASPPAERHDLQVRFLQARDMVAAKQ